MEMSKDQWGHSEGSSHSVETLIQWKAQFEREEGEGEELAGEPGDV